jgi:hypothetical protein
MGSMRSTIFVIMLSVFLGSLAWAQEFSADIISTTAAGTYSGKIFVAKDKVRTEMAGAVTITRMDKNVIWILMSEKNMYLEQPLNPSSAPAVAETVHGEIERTLLGEETIDGKKTNKYKVTYNAGGKEQSIFQWIDVSSKIPLKAVAEDGSWSFEYKNLTLGVQPESLFEIPAGYKEFSYNIPTESLPQDVGE